MSHWAQIDENNIVTQVLVGPNHGEIMQALGIHTGLTLMLLCRHNATMLQFLMKQLRNGIALTQITN